MKAGYLSVLAVLFFFTAAPLRAEQAAVKEAPVQQKAKAPEQQEDEALREELIKQRKELMRLHSEAIYKENRSFQAKMDELNLTFLKKKLSSNKNITDAQKEDLISFYESQHKGYIAFYDNQHADSVDFFEKVANDKSMSQEDKKKALAEYSEKQRIKNEERRKQMEEEVKEKRLKILADIKAKKEAEMKKTNAAGAQK